MFVRLQNSLTFGPLTLVPRTTSMFRKIRVDIQRSVSPFPGKNSILPTFNLKIILFTYGMQLGMQWEQRGRGLIYQTPVRKLHSFTGEKQISRIHGERSGIPIVFEFCSGPFKAYQCWHPAKAAFAQELTIPITLGNCFSNKTY